MSVRITTYRSARDEPRNSGRMFFASWAVTRRLALSYRPKFWRRNRVVSFHAARSAASLHFETVPEVFVRRSRGRQSGQPDCFVRRRAKGDCPASATTTSSICQRRRLHASALGLNHTKVCSGHTSASIVGSGRAHILAAARTQAMVVSSVPRPKRWGLRHVVERTARTSPLPPECRRRTAVSRPSCGRAAAWPPAGHPLPPALARSRCLRWRPLPGCIGTMPGISSRPMTRSSRRASSPSRRKCRATSPRCRSPTTSMSTTGDVIARIDDRDYRVALDAGARRRSPPRRPASRTSTRRSTCSRPRSPPARRRSTRRRRR